MSLALEKLHPKSARIDHSVRILDAAALCFGRSGFHGTSMQEICAEAQMSPGALYRYFPSKDAIIEAIALTQRERDAVLFDQVEQAEGPLVTALIEGGIQHIRELLASPLGCLCAEVLAEGRRNPKIKAVFEQNYVIAMSKVQAALERAQAQGEIDPALDVAATLPVLMSMFDGILVRAAFDPAMTIDRIAPALRDILRRIVRPIADAGASTVTAGV